MKKKRWRHPFDPKTGRAIFTPVLRATGERLDLEVDYASFPKSGKWYAVYGKECGIPGCNCDAWVEEIPAPAEATVEPPASGDVRSAAEP